MLSQLESNYPSDQNIARDSTRTISAGVLATQVRALAQELQDAGVSMLALQLDNGIDWLLVDLACQHAGVCLIPLPGFFSAQQIAHVFSQAPVDAFIGGEPVDGTHHWPAKVESLLGQRVRQRSYTHTASLPLLRVNALSSAMSLPKATGKITFTSGSTGQPKGVCLSNAQLLQQAKALAELVALTAPRHLCLLPLSTLLENVAGLYSPMLSGGEVVLPGLAEIGFEGSSALNAQKFLQTIIRYQPNSIILTPQLLLVLVSATKAGWTPPATLQFVAVGGSKVSPNLLKQAWQLGIPAYEGYGLSECASVVSLNTPLQNQPGSCGQPLPHLQVTLEEGELVVSGNAMLGYLGEPDSFGQTAIRTGDLCELDEQGFLHVRGRRKNLLISSYGRNINPEWVESELLDQPLLSECVVLGDARPYCVALLRPRQPDISDAAVQNHISRVNAGLPDYAQIKRWHRLNHSFSQNGLLTANGRPQRAAIARHYAALLASLYPESQKLESA